MTNIIFIEGCKHLPYVVVHLLIYFSFLFKRMTFFIRDICLSIHSWLELAQKKGVYGTFKDSLNINNARFKGDHEKIYEIANP